MFKCMILSLLLITLSTLINGFKIEPAKVQIFPNKFRVSITNNDPDIKWVQFHVNVNKPFESFVRGKYFGDPKFPVNNGWFWEFDRNLENDDTIYIWVALQHNKLVYRDIQNPIPVEDLKKREERRTTSTTTTTTTTTTTAEPEIQKSATDKSLLESSSPNMGGTDGFDNKKTCYPSITETNLRNKQFCKDDMIFEENFNTFDTQVWSNEIRIPMAIDDAEFVLYNGTLDVNQGHLTINASLYGTTTIRRGSIDLGSRCTVANIENQCRLDAKRNFYIPPVVTGRINTKNYFNFKYGRIEIRAKFPMGDWLYPLILLEPLSHDYGSPHYMSGQLRIAFARGNREVYVNGERIDGSRVYGGAVLSHVEHLRHKLMADYSLRNKEHFGEQFHLYSMSWTPSELIMSVDGHEYGRIRTNFSALDHSNTWDRGGNDAPLDKMFYLTLGLAAGGHGDFPSKMEKPWLNTSPKATLQFWQERGEWLTTWSQPTLEVDFVRVYAI